MKRKAILLLIAGCLTLASTIAGLILIIFGISTYAYNATFTIGLYMFALSLIVCIPCLADANRGFKAYHKEKFESQPVDVDESEEAEDEEKPANTAEVVQAIKDMVIDAIEQNGNTVSSEHKPVKYCSECGCAIDKNSNYCKICGKEQE